MDKTENSEVGRDVNRVDDHQQGKNGASPEEVVDSSDDDAHSGSSSGEEGKDIDSDAEDSSDWKWNIDTSEEDESNSSASFRESRSLSKYAADVMISRSLTRRKYLKAASYLKYVSGYGMHLHLLEDLFQLCSGSYSVELDKAGLPEALSSVMHLLDVKKCKHQIHFILDRVGLLMYRPHPRSSVLHAVLNVKGLDKDIIISQLIPEKEIFLCHLLSYIGAKIGGPRVSFEQSRIFALHVEAAGPPLHYGPPQNYLENSDVVSFNHKVRLPLIPSYIPPQPVFRTAVGLNLYDQALLLYRTGAVCYKELHEIHEKEESKGHESMLNQHPQTEIAHFLESIIDTPRSLFLTCTLEVASLIQRKPERAEALRGRLPQSLIDAVMFKPQFEYFEDAVMKRYSCSEIRKIFT